MQYDLPTQQLSAQPSHTVTADRPKKHRLLGFVMWQSIALALTAAALTVLRYMGLLAPLVQTVRAKLGI